MKRDEQIQQIIRQEIDAELSFLSESPSLRYNIMNQIQGEKMMKKKLSGGFILAMILLLAGTVALAASLLWQEYVPKMKQTEQTLGDYAYWPAAQRIQLAMDLVEMGYVEAPESAAVLKMETASEQEKAAAADEIMLRLTGLEDIGEVHSTWITYAIMGHEDTWTPEQRVWWNGIVTMDGDGGATDTLLVPGDEDLSEEEAIAIARAAVMEAYGFTEEYMENTHPVANLYVTDQRPEYKRWDVQFKRYRPGSDSYVEKVYTAIVDEDGEVISDPDVGIAHPSQNAQRARTLQAQQEKEDPEIVQVYKRYAEQAGSVCFWHWTLEQKAAYSQEVRPMVQRAIDLGYLVSFDHPDAGEFDRYISCSTVYQYGLPQEGDLAEEDALRLALDALSSSYGYDAESFRYDVHSYDITDSKRPLWRFMFYPNNQYEQGADDIPFALVEMEAKTGEIVKCETFERGDMLEDYEFAMKWY